MDASPLLALIAELLERHSLEAILVGNAAAALAGAPVTTIDLDFLFRKTPVNLRKLKAIAAELEAVILTPYYPVSGLYRVSRDSDGLQLDFMPVIDGIRSFEALRRRTRVVQFGNAHLRVEGLPEIVKSEKAAGTPRNVAAFPKMKKPFTKRRITRKARLAALKKESDAALRDQIRRLLALPMERRTHFLRKRIGLHMSCL